MNPSVSLFYTTGQTPDIVTPTSAVIADGVTSLLESFTIPANYKSNDTDVASLSIGCGVTGVGASAFDGCVNLSGPLLIPDTCTTIGANAFKLCSLSGTLVLHNGIQSIGARAFQTNDFTGNLVLPPLSVIADGVFQDCTGFTGSLAIPNSVLSIGNDAFNNCSFNGTLTLGSGLTSIGISAFFGCDFTGSLVIPNSVTTIGGSAFVGNAFTGTLTLGSGLLTIGSSAFQSLGFTGGLTIPNSVTSIGENAFDGVAGMTGTLTLGSGLVTIHNGAFRGSGFTGRITIPNSVQVIDANAFRDMPNAAGVLRIGSGVTSIGNHAFAGLDGITRVECAAMVAPNAHANTFQGIGTTEIYVPQSATGYGSVWHGLTVFYELDLGIGPNLFTDSVLNFASVLRQATYTRVDGFAINKELTGFAYPMNTLTAAVAGQWYADNVPIVGETGNTYVVRLDDIGRVLRCGDSDEVTVWKPTDIAGVQVTYVSPRGALTGLSPDVVALDGQSVARWNDLLGSQANQTNSDFRPTYRSTAESGNPAIEFDGFTERLDLGSTAEMAQFNNRATGYLIAGFRDTFVGGSGGSPVRTVVEYSTGISINNNRMALLSFGPTGRPTATIRTFDGGTEFSLTGTALTDSNYQVLTLEALWSSGQARLRRNGVAQSTAAIPAANCSATNSLVGRIGASRTGSAASNFFWGRIACIISANQLLSNTDRSRLERFAGLFGGLNIPLV